MQLYLGENSVSSCIQGSRIVGVSLKEVGLMTKSFGCCGFARGPVSLTTPDYLCIAEHIVQWLVVVVIQPETFSNREDVTVVSLGLASLQ